MASLCLVSSYWRRKSAACFSSLLTSELLVFLPWSLIKLDRSERSFLLSDFRSPRIFLFFFTSSCHAIAKCHAPTRAVPGMRAGMRVLAARMPTRHATVRRGTGRTHLRMLKKVLALILQRRKALLQLLVLIVPGPARHCP